MIERYLYNTEYNVLSIVYTKKEDIMKLMDESSPYIVEY